MSLTSQTQFAERSEQLAGALGELGIDLVLVSHPVNLQYLTGYTGSNGLALIGAGRRVFITDFRYVEQAAAQVDPSFEQVHTGTATDLIAAVGGLLSGDRVTLGFDDQDVSVATHARLAGGLGDHVTLLPAGGLVEELRRAKNAREIELITASQRLADAALEQLLAGPIVGRSERELAVELEHAMRVAGAAGPSFSSIVAGGPHGALPHAAPRDVPVEADTFLVIDWGAVLEGYCSDCTRTVATGQVSGRMAEVYETVLTAQMTALGAITAGADCHGVDAVARDMIAAAGYGDYFGHGLGHGVGLEVHEGPTLSRRIPAGSDALQVDDVVTDEPGIYLPGEFGIRIEDLCVVTEGAPRVLTSVSKELRVVS